MVSTPTGASNVAHSVPLVEKQLEPSLLPATPAKKHGTKMDVGPRAQTCNAERGLGNADAWGGHGLRTIR
eukprot:2342522-Prymnesium_polylepis.1